MITDPQAAKIAETYGPGYSWHREAAADERLRLGKRYRRWLTLRYLAQEGRPIPSHMQGAAVPSEKALITMSRLGMIHEPDDTALRWQSKRLIVTRDGQAAVTWHYNVWAPLSCAPTWGLPILVRLPGGDRWPDRVFAMRAERRGDELVWLRPDGQAYTDRFTTGEWRAIP